jgi:hypothetical protein
LAVRHTTTTKTPLGFTPNTGVPQSLDVSAGIILEFRKFTAQPVTIPFVFALFCGRKFEASGVGISSVFQQAWIGSSRDR